VQVGGVVVVVVGGRVVVGGMVVVGGGRITDTDWGVVEIGRRTAGILVPSLNQGSRLIESGKSLG
jgi:hypothetical protein